MCKMSSIKCNLALQSELHIIEQQRPATAKVLVDRICMTLVDSKKGYDYPRVHSPYLDPRTKGNGRRSGHLGFNPEEGQAC